MKYRLKDQELQAKLDDLTNGAFSKNLHPYDETLFASYGYRQVLVEALSGKSKHLEPKFGFWFTPDEIESIPQYDPHGWNEYPAVIPPEIDTYRVEAFENADESEPTRLAGYWDGKRFLIAQEGGRTRFRPWEDEE